MYFVADAAPLRSDSLSARSFSITALSAATTLSTSAGAMARVSGTEPLPAMLCVASSNRMSIRERKDAHCVAIASLSTRSSASSASLATSAARSSSRTLSPAARASDMADGVPPLIRRASSSSPRSFSTSVAAITSATSCTCARFLARDKSCSRRLHSSSITRSFVTSCACLAPRLPETDAACPAPTRKSRASRSRVRLMAFL
mmetsp:Transcript_22349/g.69143  ORF Transcript_22349/g.69143 Transcript_22349/m.69143 type:complete len:203 (+) Transcript_22349:932-1540(+)